MPTTLLRAFHGDRAIKDRYVARLLDHKRLDQLWAGHYLIGMEDGVPGPGFRGCAVGCTLHSTDVRRYESELGIPMLLAYLQEGIFETLASNDAPAFAVDFLWTIPVGADLHRAAFQFAL